jgi:hypothetical protein
MRNLEAILVEQGYVQHFFQVVVAVVTDIGIGTVGFQEMIALFPYPDGMGLDAREILQIFDGKSVHTTILDYKYNPELNLFAETGRG